MENRRGEKILSVARCDDEERKEIERRGIMRRVALLGCQSRDVMKRSGKGLHEGYGEE